MNGLSREAFNVSGLGAKTSNYVDSLRNIFYNDTFFVTDHHIYLRSVLGYWFKVSESLTRDLDQRTRRREK